MGTFWFLGCGGVSPLAVSKNLQKTVYLKTHPWPKYRDARF